MAPDLGHIPNRLFDMLADPVAAPASSTAAGTATAMAAALLSMALGRTKPPPFGSVAQARAIRRRAEGRVAQATLSYERARSALAADGDAANQIGATLPVLEGICTDAADVVGLAEKVMSAVDPDARADVAAAAHLAAGAGRAARALFDANRLRPSAEDVGEADTLTERAERLARGLA